VNDESPTRSVAPERLGRYELLRKLGQGGMGEVFLAHDTKLDRRVAVKVLPPHAVHDPDAVARFQREAKALAQLGHPGIVQAFDSDSAGDSAGERHFLVMEYVDGVSLSELLKRQGKLTPGQAADYVHQAALALQHAHDKGLVHRDLKPSNLLLTSDGRVKLLDLGLARFLQDQIADPGLTRENSGMGTPDYAAPEQFRDAHHADERSDIYSLGCTLYHLLTGQVPFPGTSMQEKCNAHEHKAPAAIQALSPEAPVGLIAAVEKMMAKKPADRYQSAGDVAGALAPNVRGSSVCFDALMSTRTWQAAPATLPMYSRRRSLLPWVGGAVAGITVALAALFLFWPPPPDGERGPGQVAQAPGKDTPTDTARKDTTAKGPDPKQEPGPGPGDGKEPKNQEPVKPAAFEDPDVLTVAQDGSGRFKSITEALAEVKPGQTVRVLDDKVYAEPFTLRGASHEGVTLEAVRKAVLLSTQERQPAVVITGVSGVTVRGFRLRTTANRVTLIGVAGRCPGLRLEYLEFQPSQPNTTGVEIYTGNLTAADAPLTIQHCHFRGQYMGVSVTGKMAMDGADAVTRRVVVRGNVFAEGQSGVVLMGEVGQVHVVGNRMFDMGSSGVQFQMTGQASRDLLIANNTMVRCARGLRLLDYTTAVCTDNIRVCNNLILETAIVDLAFADLTENKNLPKPGDGGLLGKQWHVHHNWRELINLEEQAGKDVPGRVPLGTNDKQAKHFDGINRDVKSPNYLRPDAGSAAATEGAGQTDPSLPTYIGALPPAGLPAWDWSRTWLVPPPGLLLTVSREEKDGGKYRTLADALRDAKPWATIRVLDAGSYEEPVILDDAKKYEGLVLEAPAGAAVLMKGAARKFWEIQDVPHVRLRGFHFRSEGMKFYPWFITVGGAARGVVLEQLTFTAGPKDEVCGIQLQNIEVAAPGPPLVVRGCRVSVSGDGIAVRAPVGAAETSKFGGVALHDNDLSDAFRGIYVTGKLANVQLSCNRVWHCRMAGLQTEAGPADLRAITLVNNTVCDTRIGWRCWLHGDGQPTAGQVALLNNLVSDVTGAAFFCIRQSAGGKADTDAATARAAPQLWQMAGNWVDNSGEDVHDGIPAIAAGHILLRQPFRSTKPGHADFLRPTAELYSQMSAAAPPLWLPPYAGAVPPEGTELWDWERYWKWR
jgi:serine/threonine protein kinase